MIIVNNSCKGFPTKIFKVSEESILFSTRKISRKIYLKSLYNFQCGKSCLVAMINCFKYFVKDFAVNFIFNFLHKF